MSTLPCPETVQYPESPRDREEVVRSLLYRLIGSYGTYQRVEQLKNIEGHYKEFPDVMDIAVGIAVNREIYARREGMPNNDRQWFSTSLEALGYPKDTWPALQDAAETWLSGKGDIHALLSRREESKQSSRRKTEYEERGLHCPCCGYSVLANKRTKQAARGRVERRKKCRECGAELLVVERVEQILVQPVRPVNPCESGCQRAM